MTKRKMNENSLKNLKPNTFNNSDIAKKAQKKSVEKRKENIKRETAKEWLWNEFGIELSKEIMQSGTIKEKLELLKAILPPDKQVNEITTDIEYTKIYITNDDLQDIDRMQQLLTNVKHPEIVYISPEEQKATEEHILSVINDGQDAEYQIKSLLPVQHDNTED